MAILNFSNKREQNEIHSDFAEREKIQGKNFLNVPNKRGPSETCFDSAERGVLRPKGNVPNLRFGGYSDEWSLNELQKVATLSKGFGISKDQLSENGTPCILYGELYTKYNSEIISEVYSKTELDTSNLVKSKENDVIIPCSGETAIDISTARCVPFNGVLLGGDLNIIRLKNQNGGFFAYQLNSKRKVDIAKVAQGVSVVHLYGEHLKRVKVAYPTYSEQKKIADFLSLLDDRIATQNKIIEDLKKLKVAITQKISKDRFNKKVMLSELLTERCEKNKDLYPVHSVSVSEGVINQVDYLGRSFAANDISNYNVVYYGDIVYTKSPTGDFPYGIVKMSSIITKASVSPLYGVYRPCSESIGIYLHNYFCNPLNAKNYLHKLIQKGAKNTINITNKRFLENEISLPSENLLNKYSLFISSFDLKIKLELKTLLLLQRQKQYLLQQMFI